MSGSKGRTYVRIPVRDRFMTKFDIDPETGCWNWTAGFSSGGGKPLEKRYGAISIGRKTRGAHCVAYELFKGPIPNGFQIDHLCRNTHCVNPDHLEAVTVKVNVGRSENICAKNSKKTRCVNGHLLSGDNVIPHPKGWRICRPCQVAAARRSYLRKLGRA